MPGLNDFVAEDGTVMHPPVAPVFWSFRIMVGTGMAMLTLSWFATFMLWRRRKQDDAGGALSLPQPFLWAFSAMAFSGWVATLSGWYTTEIGRQPWLVNGVLTTKEAVGPVAAPMVATTLVIYLVVYVVLTIMYIGVISYLAWKAARGESTTPLAPSSGVAEVEAAAGLLNGTTGGSVSLPATAVAEVTR